MPSKELIALAANAMEERRKELIAQPLSRIYRQLAEAAAGATHAALQEPTEEMRLAAAWDMDNPRPVGSEERMNAIIRAAIAASPLGNGGNGYG